MAGGPPAISISDLPAAPAAAPAPAFFHKPTPVRFESGRLAETDGRTVGVGACRLVGLLVGGSTDWMLVDLPRSLESPQDLGSSVANHFID